MSIARNRLLSTLGVARRHATVAATTTVADRTYSQKLRNVAYWRTLDYNIRMSHSMTQPTWSISKESRELMAIWPDVVRDLREVTEHFDIPHIASEWMDKVLQYNVPGGKKESGLVVVHTYKMLVPNDQITQENIRLIRILAWCVELFHAFTYIIDDIEDKSLFHRHQPCWYLHNDLGLAAINDGIMMEHVMYQLLRKHFSGKDCYMDLLELFQDIGLIMIFGQTLDLQSTNFDKTPNLNLFTTDHYNSIVKNKASCWFILLINIAMHFAGIKDQEMFRQAKPILLEIGHLFQVYNDYLDCYGKLEIVGKNGSDIEEGKCTWLVVMALQHVTPKQRKILEECYGSPDPEKVRRVKQLYNDLGLPNMYSIWQEKTYNLINTYIKQISCGLPHDIFLKMVDEIYRKEL